MQRRAPVNATSNRFILLLSRGKKLRTKNKINKSIMTGRIAAL
jgi:hypothetical protein